MSPALIAPLSPAHQSGGHGPRRESRCVIGLWLQQALYACALQAPGVRELPPLQCWCLRSGAGKGDFDEGTSARRRLSSKEQAHCQVWFSLMYTVTFLLYFKRPYFSEQF